MRGRDDVSAQGYDYFYSHMFVIDSKVLLKILSYRHLPIDCRNVKTSFSSLVNLEKTIFSSN